MADASLDRLVRAATASGMKTRSGGRPAGARARIVSLACADKASRERVAGALGKSAGLELVRVDLTMVVSRYIGETEENLDRVFASASGRASLLWFDEADALFGKRSDVKDAHDKYANQEVAYLLQRIEAFEGIVVLASNLRQHIDGAVDLIAECG